MFGIKVGKKVLSQEPRKLVRKAVVSVIPPHNTFYVYAPEEAKQHGQPKEL